MTTKLCRKKYDVQYGRYIITDLDFFISIECFSTVKLGCKQTLCYNEHILWANWSFFYTNLPGYNEQKWPVPNCSLLSSLTNYYHYQYTTVCLIKTRGFALILDFCRNRLCKLQHFFFINVI